MSESKNSVHNKEITLARWSTRFWAWLVDFIIVAVAIEIIFLIAYPPLASFNQGAQGNLGLGAVSFAIQSLLFFAYWTYFESTTGQSIGRNNNNRSNVEEEQRKHTKTSPLSLHQLFHIVSSLVASLALQ